MKKRQTVQSLRQIRRNISQGQSKQTASIQTIHDNTTRHHSKINELDVKAKKRLKRKAYPWFFGSRLERLYGQAIHSANLARKGKLVSRLFGKKGDKLGFLIIQPELLGQSRNVKRFLEDVGCQVVFSKHKTLTRTQIYQMFGYKQMRKYPDFVVMANILLHSPIRVLVFRHPPKEAYFKKSRYLEHLKQTHPEKFTRLKEKLSQALPQTVFVKLFKGSHEREEPGTLRTEFALSLLKKVGLDKGKPTVEGQKLDMFKALEAFPNITALDIFGGVHAPKPEEFEREAIGLFSVEDLKNLGRVLNEKK